MIASPSKRAESKLENSMPGRLPLTRSMGRLGSAPGRGDSPGVVGLSDLYLCSFDRMSTMMDSEISEGLYTIRTKGPAFEDGRRGKRNPFQLEELSHPSPCPSFIYTQL